MGADHEWRVWHLALLPMVRRGTAERLGTDAGRLVDSMMGKGGDSYLIASTFLHEVCSLAKGIAGGEVGGQVWKRRRWYEIAVQVNAGHSACKWSFSGHDAV